jgi:CRP-like cAMP-binding protein
VSFDVNVEHMVSNPLPAAALVRKLETLGVLTAATKDALADIRHTIRQFVPRDVLMREDDEPSSIFLMIEGCVFRSTVLASGQRQIMALQIAGDMLNLQNLFLAKMDHSITALAPTTVALIPHQEIRELLDAHPLVAMRLWHETFIDGAISRRWLAGVGRRSAYARLAHLICEFVARMRAAGLSDGETFDLPLTQNELGDALGLSTVHINRTVKKLHEAGLVSWHHHSFTILDFERLKEVADFDDAYLEL